MKNDFTFISNLAEQFFQIEHIRRRLQHVEEKGLKGWETWLQIEFSVFLDSCNNVKDCSREHLYLIDRRSERERKHMLIDFTFRKKNASTDFLIALEIKQNLSVSSCIKGMMADACKVWLMRGSVDNIRSMWCLGVHPQVAEDKFDYYIDKYSQEFDVGLLANCIENKAIKDTNFSYTIF